jgi:hypothetical protein
LCCEHIGRALGWAVKGSCGRADGASNSDVIPAKAGIQLSSTFPKSWIPAFAGMTKKNGAARSTLMTKV